MVGAVNRVPPIPLQAAAGDGPTAAGRRARGQGDALTDPTLEALRRARRAEMESLLASMASAPHTNHAMAAHTLQEAERKLVRLKAEARAAAASGDQRAARPIARDLAVIARQIADAAQDYAVAEAQPDVVSPALAKAAARINAPSPAQSGDAIDAGALVGEAASAAAEVTQAASDTGRRTRLGRRRPRPTARAARSGRRWIRDRHPTAPPQADRAVRATRISWSRRTGCSKRPWSGCARWRR